MAWLAAPHLCRAADQGPLPAEALGTREHREPDRHPGGLSPRRLDPARRSQAAQRLRRMVAAVSRLTAALTLAAALAGGALAQPAPEEAAPTAGPGDEPAYQPDQSEPPVMVTAGIEAVRGSGALLRGLDKVTGRTTDIALDLDEARRFGRLQVRLGD